MTETQEIKLRAQVTKLKSDNVDLKAQVKDLRLTLKEEVKYLTRDRKELIKTITKLEKNLPPQADDACAY